MIFFFFFNCSLIIKGGDKMEQTVANKVLRKMINYKNQRKLKNHSFSLICNNCNGGYLCHDLHEQFRTPFVNLWLTPADMIKYLSRLNHYRSCELEFVKDNPEKYPIAMLDDIKIYFRHYQTEEEARKKWLERTSRMDEQNLFIWLVAKDGCTEEDIEAFDRLPYPNKVVFVKTPHPHIQSAFYTPGHEDDLEYGNYFEFVKPYSGRKGYDQFDFVEWFNTNGKGV